MRRARLNCPSTGEPWSRSQWSRWYGTG